MRTGRAAGPLCFQTLIPGVVDGFGEHRGAAAATEDRDFELGARRGEVRLDEGEGEAPAGGVSIGAAGRQADQASVRIDRLVAVGVRVFRVDRQVDQAGVDTLPRPGRTPPSLPIKGLSMSTNRSSPPSIGVSSVVNSRPQAL